MEGARALSWAGRDLWPSPCFGVSSCPLEASGRSKGAPPSCPQLEGLEGRKEMLSAPGWVQGKRHRPSFPSLWNSLLLPAVGPLALTFVALVTHSLQTFPPGNFMDRANSRATVNFISSGKTFGVCLNASF